MEDKILLPIHLLIASLQEKTGVLGEIILKSDMDVSSLRTIVRKKMANSNLCVVSDRRFSIPVSKEVQDVFQEAIKFMKNYNQVFVNEGHLLKALLTTNTIDEYVSDEDKKVIKNLGTTARDMITHLGNDQFPQMDSTIVRKVNKKEYAIVEQFVESNFSFEWSQTIKEGFSLNDPHIYIAIADKEIIGFAAFDVYKGKKCYFGPMGVSNSNRKKGVGTMLLHHCLKEMKEIGYEYAIIGEAGPIEFYEKACHAVVISNF
nr:GNAT family N-acetyltransferase [Cytobacillus eiseniae]